MRGRTIIVLLVLALLCAGTALGAIVSWGPEATTFVGDAQGPNRVSVYQGQAGTGAGDFDNTQQLVAPDSTMYHVLPYTAVDLGNYGVPSDAKYAVFGIKAIITKSSTKNGVADVFAFMRAPGSQCCTGLPQAPNFPIDAGYGQVIEGMVQQAVAQLPGDGQRSWSQITVPVVNGQVELSWGYKKVAGAWPSGDAVAIDFYLDGYFR